MSSIVLVPFFTNATETLFKLDPNRDNSTEVPVLADEIDAEWEDLFASSQDLLERMANEALVNYHEGRTTPLIPDEL